MGNETQDRLQQLERTDHRRLALLRYVHRELIAIGEQNPGLRIALELLATKIDVAIAGERRPQQTRDVRAGEHGEREGD